MVVHVHTPHAGLLTKIYHLPGPTIKWPVLVTGRSSSVTWRKIFYNYPHRSLL